MATDNAFWVDAGCAGAPGQGGWRQKIYIYGGIKRRRYRRVEEKRACLCQETSRKRACIEEGGGTRSERAEGSPCRWGSPGCGWEWSSAGCWSGPDLRIHTVKHTQTRRYTVRLVQTRFRSVKSCTHTHTHERRCLLSPHSVGTKRRILQDHRHSIRQEESGGPD